MCQQDAQDAPEAERSWHMEVVLVRTAERLLDTLGGLERVDRAFSGPEPSPQQAREALQELLPALVHLWKRAADL